jgi:hypothetical protein
MGRWRAWSWIASSALAASGSCALLAGCGHKPPNCMPDGGPGDGGGDGGPQDEGGFGSINVGGMVENCPTITSIGIAPNELDLGGGGMATLTATATVPIGGMPMFSWDAPSGIFGQPDQPVTTFECTAAGDVTVTVTATFEGCSTHLSGVITCLEVDAGH